MCDIDSFGIPAAKSMERIYWPAFIYINLKPVVYTENIAEIGFVFTEIARTLITLKEV